MLLITLLATLLAGPVAEPASLVDAARNNDKTAMRALIKQGANVNATAGDGTTALHWASYRDDLEAVDLLLKAGAKANAANDLGATPLWNACENGSVAMVRKLLNAGADPKIKLLLGETTLMAAAESGNAEIAELLLAKGADINARAARGQTALMWAVGQKHPAVVKVLLAHKADIHLKSDEWTYVQAVPPHGNLIYNKAIPHGGETALMFAARVGDFDSAQLLVAAGANVNDADAWGVSATTLAEHSGFGEMARFFLDNGADASASMAGFTALHLAIMRRDEKTAEALLAHGADPNFPVKTWTPTRRSSDDFNFPPELVGATPFWLAARFSQPNVMRLLARAGATANTLHRVEYYTESSDELRKLATTPLMAAVGMGGGRAWETVPAAQREGLTLEAVKIAVELGVDLNAANVDGKTALDGARTLRFESVIQFLTEKGAKAGTPAAAPGRGGAGAAPARGGQAPTTPGGVQRGLGPAAPPRGQAPPR